MEANAEVILYIEKNTEVFNQKAVVQAARSKKYRLHDQQSAALTIKKKQINCS